MGTKIVTSYFSMVLGEVQAKESADAPGSPSLTPPSVTTQLLIRRIVSTLRGVHLGLNPLPRLRSHFQGACVRSKTGQLGPIARQSENENAPCSGLCGLMRGESQGMPCYARADVRSSGKPGVPVGQHEETIRIPSLF